MAPSSDKKGNKVQVYGFTKKIGGENKVDVLDAEICYNCKYSVKSCIIIIINALYLKDINITLLSLFMMILPFISICMSQVPSNKLFHTK